MDEALRWKLIEALRRGDDLPRSWLCELFPAEPRRVELVYPAKQREEDILGLTVAVPLRPVTAFGPEDGRWRNMLIHGDNLRALKALLERKEEGQLRSADGTPGARLVYIDPPFATKREFRGRQDQTAYQDRIAGVAYVEFLRKRLVLLRELLAPDGCLFVHLDWKMGPYMRVILDEVFGEANFRNEIIVRRTQKPFIEGQRISSLNVGFDTLYLYAASGKTRFAPVYRERSIAESWHALDAPNWSGTRPRLVYELFGHLPPQGRCWAWEPKRAQEAIARGDLRPNSDTGKPEYRIPARERILCSNLWDDVSAYAFGTGYPTEKSEKLLWRVIEMGSREGDLVLDAFAGSGTTCAVAEKLGRRWVGLDCGRLAVHTMQKRMLGLRSGLGKRGKPLQARPFAVYLAAEQRPQGEALIPDSVDAAEPDLVQPPKVGWEVSLMGPSGGVSQAACLSITRFDAFVQRRGRTPLEGFAALSMVLVDPAYDGSLFRARHIFLPPELQQDGWQARFSAHEIGAQVMVVVVDICGNEARLVINGEAFGAGSHGFGLPTAPAESHP